MMGNRSLGWRKDPLSAEGLYNSPRRALFTSREKLKAMSFPELERASHLHTHEEMIEQGGLGTCFANGVQRSIMTWQRLRGLPVKRLSRRAGYWQSRALEYASLGGERARLAVIEAGDVGVYPFFGFQAISDGGFILEEDCPYMENIWDRAEMDIVLNEQPKPSLFIGAFDRTGIDTIRLDEIGVARTKQVVAFLKARCPIGFGIQVDLAYERNTGSTITEIDPYLIQGGHWTNVAAVVPKGAIAGRYELSELIADVEASALKSPSEVQADSELICWNWWGEDHGIVGGIYRLSAGLFGSRYVSDVTAMNLVPEAQ